MILGLLWVLLAPWAGVMILFSFSFSILSSIYCSVFSTPFSFLKNPVRWNSLSPLEWKPETISLSSAEILLEIRPMLLRHFSKLALPLLSSIEWDTLTSCFKSGEMLRWVCITFTSSGNTLIISCMTLDLLFSLTSLASASVLLMDRRFGVIALTL